jgi:hypothetical protein
MNINATATNNNNNMLADHHTAKQHRGTPTREMVEAHPKPSHSDLYEGKELG